MKIDARFHCKEIAGNIRSGEYELPEGATLAVFLDEAQRLANNPLTEQQKDYMAFMVNGKAAEWPTELHDGDLVRILYKILGG